MTATPAPETLRRPSMRLAGARAVFERDFLVFTSRPRFLFLRTLVVLLPALVMLTVIGTTANVSYMGSSRLGGAFYSVSAMLVPSLVMLLAPVLAASCISSERALNTLQIVLASPVSPFAFVFAKFVSRLCVVMVLIFATLPLAGICFLFGGVSAGLFLEFVAFAVGMAVLGTAAGIVASSWARSVAAAAMSSYFLAIAVPLLHLSGVAIASAVRNNGTLFTEGAALLPANPFFAWTKLGIASMRGAAVDSPGWTFLAWTCGFAAIAIVFGAWRVGREAAHEVARKGGPRTASEMRFENPVLDRGLRGTLIHRPRAKSWIRLGFLLLVAGVILTLAWTTHSAGEEAPHMVFLGITTFFVALAAMSTAAHSIASERETGALDMLLATRLTTREVARGKFAAVLLGVAPLVAVALVYGLVAAAFSKLELVTVGAWLVSVLIMTPLFAAVGLVCSAGAATAGRGVLRAFAVMIGGAVVHSVGAGIVMALARSISNNSLVWYLWGPSPFFIGITPLALSAERHWNDEQSNALISWLLWSGVYVAVAIALVSATVTKLERRNEAA